MATRSSAKTDDLFIALAHELRRRILRAAIAGDRELSPTELSERLDEPLSKVSYHVRVLARCGALRLARTRRVRGSTEHFYRPTVREHWARSALRQVESRPRRGKR